MLERLDNKYVVDAAVLQAAVPQLARAFDILEIDGRRAFTYETCYFDDPSRAATSITIKGGGAAPKCG